MTIRNRIKGLEQVKISDLQVNEKNFRLHGDRQKRTLKGVLDEVGIADALIGRRIGKGKNAKVQLLDGHLRMDVLKDTMKEVPVLIIDVTDQEADLILATLDPISAMADLDPKLQSELYAELTANSAELDAFFRKQEEDGLAAEIEAIARMRVDDPTVPPVGGGGQAGTGQDGDVIDQREYRNFAVLLTSEKEETVRHCTDAAKRTYSCDTTAEALFHVCQDWMERHSVEV